MRESVLTDAQTRLMPDELDDASLTEKERRGLERMLMDQYGIPWVLSALELDALGEEEEDQLKVAMEPSLIFSLTVQCLPASKCSGDVSVPCQLGIRGGRSTWHPGYWGSALVAECSQL